MTDETPTDSVELKATWTRVRSVWWLLCWRSGVVCVVGGFLISNVLSFQLGLYRSGENFLLVVGFLWSFPVYLWATRSALRNQYKTFRIALVPVPNVAGGRELEVNWQRVRSVWWLLCWRGGAVGVVGGNLIFTAGSLIQFALYRSGSLHWGVNIKLSVAAALIWWFAVYLWAIRSALRKQYKTFRIALVPVPNVAAVFD